MGRNPGNGLSLLALSAVAVGSMVGAGIFTLPRSFGASTGPMGALIAWAISGAGMYALARVFQTLSERRPDLDAGIYAYAREGFGNYMGFLAAFGYWFVSCIANVAYWVLITAMLGVFFPAFGNGNSVSAFVLSTTGVWVFHSVVMLGVKSAATTNTVVTIAKLVPIVVFLVLVAWQFDASVFAENFWGGRGMENVSVFQQARTTMLMTVFVFIGIEGASVYSRYAERRSDVGKATIAAFLFVLLLMVLVTLLPYGVLPRSDVASLPQPSMAALMGTVVGQWGAVFICLGVLISVLGAYLAWLLLSIEVLYVAAREKDMPERLARLNHRGVPAASLWLTTLMIQLLLFITLATDDAVQFLIELSGTMILVPYFLVAAFALRSVSAQAKCHRVAAAWEDYAIAGVALIYAMGMVYAGGMKALFMSLLFYIPGTSLYVWARCERNLRIFTRAELWIFGLMLGVIVCIVGFAHNTIAP